MIIVDLHLLLSIIQAGNNVFKMTINKKNDLLQARMIHIFTLFLNTDTLLVYGICGILVADSLFQWFGRLPPVS